VQGSSQEYLLSPQWVFPSARKSILPTVSAAFWSPSNGINNRQPPLNPNQFSQVGRSPATVGNDDLTVEVLKIFFFIMKDY
jgi:hypothetical protein